MMKAPVSLIPHFIRDFDANMMSIKDGLFNQTVAEFHRHMMGVWVRHCDFSQYVLAKNKYGIGHEIHLHKKGHSTSQRYANLFLRNFHF